MLTARHHYTLNSEDFALKVCRKSKGCNHLLEEEQHVVSKLNHPFIIKTKADLETESHVLFLMELAEGGDLFDVLNQIYSFSEDQAKFYVASVVLAMEYLHQANIVYMDLKPENVVLDGDGYVKITDFGLSKDLSKDLSQSRLAKTNCRVFEALLNTSRRNCFRVLQLNMENPWTFGL